MHFLFWFCNLFIAEFSRARSGVPWVSKFRYLYIQEILLLRKSSLRSSVGNSTPSCKLGWNFAFQAPAARFSMATRILRKNKRTTPTKPILFFDLISMSLLMWITEKKLDREIKKQRRPISLGVRKTWKFYTGSEKMRNASGHQGENDHEWQWKKVHRNTYDIWSIRRVTMKFLEVSCCSRAKQRQRNVQKKKLCLARQNCFFPN